MIDTIAYALLGGFALLLGYSFVGYPLLLRLLAAVRRKPEPHSRQAEWPTVSISVPVYNEEAQIRGLLESLLSLDYPADRRQILVTSDHSTDRTDEIVREYAERGVELLRMPKRGGKTAAENAAAARLTGEIVVNTDASIRIRPDALKPLLAAFADPTVGVASGRDVSVAHIEADANITEAGYVGYEMSVRALETRADGIIGASGCFYAIRAHLHRVPLPEHLSRDFASALIAREHGYRAVSVEEAVCLVPRTASLQREYRRKVRTLSRGMETLWFKRHLLNPLRYGTFAWMLWSHKVCRWMVPPGMLVAAIAIVLLSLDSEAGRVLATLGVVGCVLAWLGWTWPASRPMPRLLSLPTSVVLMTVAGVHSLNKALHGDENATWEPTRRETALSTEPNA